MAARKLARLGLDDAIARRLSARNLQTARDVLCRPELDLMEVLDLPFDMISSALTDVSRGVCPPFQTVLEMVKGTEGSQAPRPKWLATRLAALDNALLGGIPLGTITELVGPAGIGKTQLCFMLCVLATLPVGSGGLGGGVIYIDTENKFSSHRLFEIGAHHFPKHGKGDAVDELGSKVVVMKPTSTLEVIERLQGLEQAIIERNVKLLVLDSVAALVLSEYGREKIVQRQELLGRQAAVLKYLAETFKMAVVVTNQVMTRPGVFTSEPVFSFVDQNTSKGGGVMTDPSSSLQDGSVHSGDESHLMAALGTKWAHSVNIRIVMEAFRGTRILKIVKSPMSAVLAFPYSVTASGIVLEGSQVFDADDGGRMSIHNEGDPYQL